LKEDHDRSAVLHVHYAGKWVEKVRERDRSVIKQINIRQTVPEERSGRKGQRFNMDMEKWVEKSGQPCLIPEGRGWEWEKNPDFAPEMHKLLTLAEQCTFEVRSIQSQLAGPSGYETQPRALIIAVAVYDSGQIRNLPNAVNDGSALQKALQVSNPEGPRLWCRGGSRSDQPLIVPST